MLKRAAGSVAVAKQYVQQRRVGRVERLERVDGVERIVQEQLVQERVRIPEPSARRDEAGRELAAHHSIRGGPAGGQAVQAGEAVAEAHAQQHVQQRRVRCMELLERMGRLERQLHVQFVQARLRVAVGEARRHEAFAGDAHPLRQRGAQGLAVRS